MEVLCKQGTAVFAALLALVGCSRTRLLVGDAGPGDAGPPVSDIVSVRTGRIGCLLRVSGETSCWGRQPLGSDSMSSDTPVEVFDERSTSAIEVYTHSCLLHEDRTVACFGAAWIVGPESPWALTVPTVVPGWAGVVELALGERHVCALLESGRVSCFGRNHLGQLGNGTHLSSETPVLVAELEDAVAIGAGRDHSCAIRRAGGVVCWGSNEEHQIAATGHRWFTRPTEVAGVGDAVVVRGGGSRTCIVDSRGGLTCWGVISPPDADWEPPTRLLPAGVDRLSMGAAHDCALMRDRTVRCWGSTLWGRLGDGAFADEDRYRSEPELVSGLADIVDVSAGAYSTCALSALGAVRCWGVLHDGDGDPWNYEPVPTPVPGIP